MNLKKCRIVGLGDVFDGLVVYVGGPMFPGNDVLYPVVRIEQGSKLFSEWSIPLLPKALYLSERVLEDIADESLEFETTNPWGKVVSEHKHVSPSGVTVTWAYYEKALSVNVSQNDKTMFSAAYYHNIKSVSAFLIDIVAPDNGYDMDEIVFDLQRMKSYDIYESVDRRETKLYGKKED